MLIICGLSDYRGSWIGLDCYHLTFLAVVYKEFPLVYTGYLLPFIQTNSSF